MTTIISQPAVPADGLEEGRTASSFSLENGSADASGVVAVRSNAAPRSIARSVETTLMTLTFPATGWLIDRSDPFFLKHPFPWIGFAPVLIGLRHGFAAACASASMLAGLLAVSWRLHVSGVASFPAEPMLGLVALAILTGQFSDVWRREATRIAGRLELVERRASEFARAHLLLQFSHERLEEQSANVPHLRDALAKLQTLSPSGEGSLEALAGSMMEILATYAKLEVGTMMSFDDDGRLSRAVAKIGNADPIDPSDPLLFEAQRRRELTYVHGRASAEPPAAGAPSRLLAAVPAIDTAGKLRAVLCVQSMPFVAFHRKNLEALAVLAGHFADLAVRSERRFDPEQERANDFDSRLARALHDCRVSGVSSVVAAIAMKEGSPVSNIVDLLLAGSLRSGGTAYRTVASSGRTIVWILLPMANEAAGRALERRVEATVERELNRPLEQLGAVFRFRALDQADTAASVSSLMSRALGEADE